MRPGILPPPTMTEKMRRHIERVRALRAAGLTVAHVVETFAWWRIIPLKRRDLAYTYSGVMDPNRESKEGDGPIPILLESFNPLMFGFNLDLPIQKC